MALIDRAVNVSVSNDAHFVLLTINHPTGIVRLVDNLEPVISRGRSFMAYPFSITLPTQDTEKTTELTLSIDNVDQRLIDAIRGTVDPPTVMIEMVLSSSPDTVYAKYDYLQLANVTYDAQTITGVLIPNDWLHKAFPACSYDGVQFPDLQY